MLPQDAAKVIEKALPFRFGTNDFTTYRKRLGVGPNAGGTAPGSDDRYCLYAKAVKRHVYTPALVKKAIADLSSVEGYVAAMGKSPTAKEAIGERRQAAAPSG
jgi:hypothetical protein